MRGKIGTRWITGKHALIWAVALANLVMVVAVCHAITAEVSGKERKAMLVELIQRAQKGDSTSKAHLAHITPRNSEEFTMLVKAVDEYGLDDVAKGLSRTMEGAQDLRKEYRTLLVHRHPLMRMAACEYLGKMKDHDAKGTLVRLLDDPGVRMSASQALGEIASEDVIPEMIKRAGKSNGETLYGVAIFSGIGAKALVEEAVRIGPVEKGGGIIGVVKRALGQGKQRAVLLQWLSLMGNPAMKEYLLTQKNNPDSQVRTAVLSALSHMGDETLIDMFTEQANSRVMDEYEAAIHGLGRIQSETSFRKLEYLMLSHPNYDVREAAARELGYSGDSLNIPALQKVLEKDQSEMVRESARWAINNIRSGGNQRNKNHPHNRRNQPGQVTAPSGMYEPAYYDKSDSHNKGGYDDV